MIYTITPNPCLDLGGKVTQLVPDEKSYVQDEVRSPGGNSINAARIIRRLGAPVTATGFLGGGVGKEVAALLSKEKVRHEFIEIKGHTRINITVSNRADHRQTRLSFPGPPILPSEREALFKYILKVDKNCLLLLGGSLPPSFTGSHLLKILQIAEARRIPIIVDVPGPWLKYTSSAPPLLIKPNLVEFQALTGKKVSTLKEVLKLAKDLTQKTPLVCVSSVEGGALLATRDGCWHGRIPKIAVKTTVGAGDSMVGAMSAYLWNASIRTQRPILELAQGKNPKLWEELLRHGLAAACGTLSLPGMFLATKKEIQHYLPKIELHRLS